MAKQHPWEDFAHVGPGTLAGRYIRSYWQPVCIAAELKPNFLKRIKFCGEHYTLYRGATGEPHVVQDRCPHRGTALSYGWVEGDDIRCRFHGWKFDCKGQANELPAEEPGFAAKIRIASYPTREYLGLVFAYLGEGEPPEFRRWHEVESEKYGGLEVHGWTLPYNYFQRVENDYDEVHVNFVHRDRGRQFGFPQIPEVQLEEREFGLLRTGFRKGSRRFSYGFMPGCFLTTTPDLATQSTRQLHLAFRLPADDTTCLSFVVNRGSHGQREWAEPWEKTVARFVNCEIRLDDVDQNNPFLFVIQDTVALLGQGVIADREHERLGKSDKGVILLRKIWAREMKALADGRKLTQWKHRPDLVASFTSETAEGAPQPAG